MAKASFSKSDLMALGLQEVEPGVFRKCTSSSLSDSTPKKTKRSKAKKLPTTDLFITFVKIELGIELIPEYRFHPKRQWRFDYAIPEQKIAIECEGGIYTRGRHTRGAGYKADMEKYNEAVKLGWKLLRYTPDELLHKTTIDEIGHLLTADFNYVKKISFTN